MGGQKSSGRGRDSQDEQGGNSPVEAFCKFLEDTWSDNDDETAFAIWKLKVSQNTHYALDALETLDAIMANPPDGLARLMRTCGWIYLEHPAKDENSPAIPYSDQEYLEWLKEANRRLIAIYTENKPQPQTRRQF
jgi:hypothetical protein